MLQCVGVFVCVCVVKMKGELLGGYFEWNYFDIPTTSLMVVPLCNGR